MPTRQRRPNPVHVLIALSCAAGAIRFAARSASVSAASPIRFPSHIATAPPSATATRPPMPMPLHAARTPRALANGSATSTPARATATTTSAVRVVAMTVAEARATVWAGIVAAPEPRIEGAVVVDRERLVTGWPVARSFLFSRPPTAGQAGESVLHVFEVGGNVGYLLDDAWPLPAEQAELFGLPPTRVETVIVVRASIGGMENRLPYRPEWYDLRPPVTGYPLCAPISPGYRAIFDVYFDATRGAGLHWHWLATPAEGGLIEAFAAASPPPLVTLTVDPGATPTSPSPAPSPWTDRRYADQDIELPTLMSDAAPAVSLPPGHVPRSIAGVAADLGVVPGSWRRYQLVTVGPPSDWARKVVTEAVDAAWQIAPDVMVVRTSWSPGWCPLGCLASTSRLGRPNVGWRFVFPNGEAFGLHTHRGFLDSGLSPLAGARLALSGVEVPASRSPAAWDTHIVPWPWRIGQRLGRQWVGGEEGDIVVPAGTFRRCHAIVEEPDSNGASAASWLCPGVGVVRRDMSSCGANQGGYAATLLEAWYSPPLVPVDPIASAAPSTHTPTPMMAIPSNPQPATPSAFPSRTAEPTATPQPVVLTLSDARASVSARMSSAPALRLRSVAYISGKALFRDWPYRPGSMFDDLMILNTDILAGLRAEDTPPEPLADMLIVVEGSIGEWHERWLSDDGWLDRSSALTRTIGCAVIDGAPRSFFHVFVDARSGRWMGAAWLHKPWQTCMLRSLTAVTPPDLSFPTEPAAGSELATATEAPPVRSASWPWPSADDVPAPPEPPRDAWQPRPLARGQVPRALAAIAAAVPVAAGGRWRYRRTRVEQWDFRWRRDEVTETIDAAWQLAPDVMLSHVSSSPGSPSLWGRGNAGAWLYTFPNGFATSLHVHRGLGPEGAAPLARMRRLFDSVQGDADQTASSRAAQWLSDLAPDAMPWPPSEAYVTWPRHWMDSADIVVPAGDFRRCNALHATFGGNTADLVHWFCPGVGRVRFDGLGHHGRSSMDLIAYDIPPLIARDAPPQPTPTATPPARVARSRDRVIRE